ncbi:MAG: archease [Candidatus Omnitrophica bacterium]|nr:archease [Candidatus Omnitrophota bacterium]MCM8806828.1 archease [Candidatus Omnitrophota bacterium]
MKKEKIKIINHTADIGIEVFGDTIEELFLNSVKGLYLVSGVKYNGEKGFLEIEIKESVLEDLLVKFLNELIYIMETKKLGGEIEKIHLEKKEDLYILKTKLKVKSIEKIDKEVKAATYHKLKIEKKEDGFLTTIIFDL